MSDISSFLKRLNNRNMDTGLIAVLVFFILIVLIKGMLSLSFTIAVRHGG